MNNEFDDQKLKDMTRECPGISMSRCMDVVNILDKDKLTNKDRNTLLEYIRLNPKFLKPTSIASMKQEIFAVIGYTSDNTYGTVSRAEISAIHSYIVRTKNEKK